MINENDEKNIILNYNKLKNIIHKDKSLKMENESFANMVRVSFLCIHCVKAFLFNNKPFKHIYEDCQVKNQKIFSSAI